MDLLEKALATRPYSWITAILIGLIAHYFLFGNISASSGLILTITVALLSWITGQTIPEYMRKKHEYDEDPRLHLSLLPSILLLILVSYTGGIQAVAVFFVLLVSIMLYITKVKNRVLGQFSFLFRGLSELSLIGLVFAVHGRFPVSVQVLGFAAAIYLITGSRNIVGDLRDVEVDGNTLASQNFRLAQFLSLLMAGVAIAIVPRPLVVLPIAVGAVSTAFWGEKHAYMCHRLYVLCTMFFLSQYLLQYISPGILPLSNLLFAGSALNLTYPYVPRKLNKLSGEVK